MIHISDLHNVVISYVSVLKYMFYSGLIWLESYTPLLFFCHLHLCLFSDVIKIALHQEKCFLRNTEYALCVSGDLKFSKLKLRKMLS